MYKFKKNIWLWTAVDRESKELVQYEVGTRETKYFERLSRKISHIESKKYASDKKAHTYTVERMNRLLRHYLARFRRKTYCWSKSLSMINDSVLLFMYRKSLSSIRL